MSELKRITQAHVEHYREHGYAIVEGFLTSQEIAGAQQELEGYLPGWVAHATDPTQPKPANWDDPAPKYLQFPYRGTFLNDVTTHPDLQRFAAMMMGDEALYCEQSHLSYKCLGHQADRDQEMHCDFGNHTLAYPPADPKYWQTAYLVYYTDVTLESGPTAVCSWQHYPEQVRWPSVVTRDDRPDIYASEVKVTVPAGSVFIYSMRTFHRGTPFLAEGARLAHFITYAPAAWKWLGIVGWSKEAIRSDFRTWVERATPAERTLFGFPAPGDPYWSEETLAGVAARYPGMDMSPYR